MKLHLYWAAFFVRKNSKKNHQCQQKQSNILFPLQTKKKIYLAMISIIQKEKLTKGNMLCK